MESIGFLGRHINMFAFYAESDRAGYSLVAVSLSSLCVAPSYRSRILMQYPSGFRFRPVKGYVPYLLTYPVVLNLSFWCFGLGFILA